MPVIHSLLFLPLSSHDIQDSEKVTFQKWCWFYSTNVSFHCVYFTWFFLFKNWGFISGRGKMKINIVSYLVENLVVHLQQGHQGHGLMEVAVLEGWGCCRSCPALVTPSLKMAGTSRQEQRSSSELRGESGKGRDGGSTTVTFPTLPCLFPLRALFLLTFYFEKQRNKSWGW